jgi:hypothetical protein
MATSGTVAGTSITTAKLIEHAVRRCGLPPTSITSETIETASQALYLLILGLANRGLNLWCVETQYIGLKEGKATYSMPPGTIDLLSLVFSRPFQLTGTNTQAGSNYTVALSQSSDCLRIGVKFNSIAASETVTLSSSDDDTTYVVQSAITKTDWVSNEWYWFSLDPIVQAQYFRISTVAAINVNEAYLVGSLFDMEIWKWNRDDYMNIPNKQIKSSISTNYYYERKLNPRVTLWPVPNDEHNHLTVVVHRQVQDIGSMTQEIEIPNRWYESIVWQLAERLCFELPEVQPERVQLVMAQSAKALAEVEMEETDGANIRMNVRIGGYTK